MTSTETLGKIPKELFSWINDAMNHIHHHIYRSYLYLNPPSFSYKTEIVIESRSKVKENLEYVSSSLTSNTKWHVDDKLVMVYDCSIIRI